MLHLRSGIPSFVVHSKESTKEPIVVDGVRETSLDVKLLPIDTLKSQESSIIEPTQVEYINKPLFAVKTNLLFDAATILNVELEIPIGQCWSIAGEWIFPWWLCEQKQYCVQVLSGNIEGRYWFGDRTNRPRMTGWFAGLHAGVGLYDLEWGTKGYQGEFFIAAGLSGGYAHTINKRGTLRMEYSLGVGYLQTNYREYEPQESGKVLAWKQDGRYSWVGPTRAKVSLVWMLSRKVKRGAER